MQVLQENYEQTLRKDLMSKEGIVQTWCQDLEMYGKKGCDGWNFFRISKEQLQFPYLHDRHCLLRIHQYAKHERIRQPFCSVRQVEPDHVRLLWREA